MSANQLKRKRIIANAREAAGANNEGQLPDRPPMTPEEAVAQRLGDRTQRQADRTEYRAGVVMRGVIDRAAAGVEAAKSMVFDGYIAADNIPGNVAPNPDKVINGFKAREQQLTEAIARAKADGDRTEYAQLSIQLEDLNAAWTEIGGNEYDVAVRRLEAATAAFSPNDRPSAPENETGDTGESWSDEKIDEEADEAYKRIKRTLNELSRSGDLNDAQIGSIVVIELNDLADKIQKAAQDNSWSDADLQGVMAKLSEALDQKIMAGLEMPPTGDPGSPTEPGTEPTEGSGTGDISEELSELPLKDATEKLISYISEEGLNDTEFYVRYTEAYRALRKRNEPDNDKDEAINQLDEAFRQLAKDRLLKPLLGEAEEVPDNVDKVAEDYSAADTEGRAGTRSKVAAQINAWSKAKGILKAVQAAMETSDDDSSYQAEENAALILKAYVEARADDGVKNKMRSWVGAEIAKAEVSLATLDNLAKRIAEIDETNKPQPPTTPPTSGEPTPAPSKPNSGDKDSAGAGTEKLVDEIIEAVGDGDLTEFMTGQYRKAEDAATRQNIRGMVVGVVEAHSQRHGDTSSLNHLTVRAILNTLDGIDASEAKKGRPHSERLARVRRALGRLWNQAVTAVEHFGPDHGYTGRDALRNTPHSHRNKEQPSGAATQPTGGSRGDGLDILNPSDQDLR